MVLGNGFESRLRLKDGRHLMAEKSNENNKESQKEQVTSKNIYLKNF